MDHTRRVATIGKISLEITVSAERSEKLIDGGTKENNVFRQRAQSFWLKLVALSDVVKQRTLLISTIY